MEVAWEERAGEGRQVRAKKHCNVLRGLDLTPQILRPQKDFNHESVLKEKSLFWKLYGQTIEESQESVANAVIYRWELN